MKKHLLLLADKVTTSLWHLLSNVVCSIGCGSFY